MDELVQNLSGTGTTARPILLPYNKSFFICVTSYLDTKMDELGHNLIGYSVLARPILLPYNNSLFITLPGS